MTVEYYAGFDVLKLKDAAGNAFSMTIDNGTDSFSFTAQDLFDVLAASFGGGATTYPLFNHGANPGNAGEAANPVQIGIPATRYGVSWNELIEGDYFSFSDSVQIMLLTEDGNATPTPISETWEVTYDSTTERITITTDAATLSFTVTCNEAAQRLLGFPAVSSSATSHTGTKTPWYVVTSSNAERSFVTDDYHSLSHGSSLVTEDGMNVVSMGKHWGVYLQDWVQRFEVHAKAQRVAASSTEPFTFQHLFEHLQYGYVFLVVWDFTETTFPQGNMSAVLRDAAYVPQRVDPDLDDYWHIAFRTYALRGVDLTGASGG